MLAVALLASACASFVPLHAVSRPALAAPVLEPARVAALRLEVVSEETSAAAVVLAPLPPEEEAPLEAQTAIVLLLCCAIGALCALDRVLISIAILPMTDEFGYSDSTKGAIAAFFSVGYCLGLLPTGAAAAAGSPKNVLLGGLIVWSLAQIATPSAAALSVPGLLAARAVMGMGEAAAIPSLQAVAARFVPPERRSLFWGCLTASLSCGTLAAYSISPPLIESNGWPATFITYGGAGLILAGLWAVGGADAPTTSVAVAAPKGVEVAPPVLDGDDGEADEATGAAWLSDVPWRELAASRPVWAMTAAHMSSNFFMYFGLSWLPTYFAYQFGMSTADASSASLLPFAAGAVGSLTAGASCDALISNAGLSRTRARKVMQTIALGGPMLCMLCLCLLSAGVGGLELSRDEAEALFVVAVGCQAGSSAGYGCGAQDISTRLSSLIYGGTSVFAVLAGASGQYFTGWLLEQNGRDFTPMFALVVLVELAGLVAWNLWWDSEKVLFD